MKYAVQLILALLTLCGIASGAATDVQLAQRNASNRVEYLTINGASNTWEALRFNGSGVLGSMTLSEWIAGSPAVNWGIIRQTDAGTQTSYIPSADTDAARGTALTTAVAAMGAGDTLWLGAGDYEITTTQLVLPAGSSIIGQGWGTTSITGEKRTNNIKLADNVTLQGLKIITTTPSNSSGHSIIGNESAAYTGVVIRDCYLQGEQDIFNGWGEFNNTDIRLVNCILVSKFDIFNHTPGTGNTITIEGCTVLADGDGNPDSSAGLAGLIAHTGVTMNVRNTRVIMGEAAAGGAGPALVTNGTGVINAQDCWLTVEAGGYDLLNSGSTGTINITGGRGSGTNGAYSTSGTITHIGADYAASAGKQPLDSDLTAVAALTTTAHGLGLLDDANASASRTSIGVVIGTDVQAYNANTSLIGQTIESAEITDGTITNGDINSGANIELIKLEAPVGTTQAGGWAGNAITTNPYAPTWTTKDLHLFYGANGEIDLPAVSTYGDKTIVIFVDDTHTITVDPNGSETIIAGTPAASLGAGVADTLSASAGDVFAYYCDGTRWIKVQTGGGGVASLTPWVETIDADGNDLNNAGTVTATTFVGDGSGLTSIPAAQVTGTLPSLTTGTLTTSEARVVTPTTGVSNVVVTTNGETTITLDATTETLTYSSTPATGTYFTYTLIGHTSDCTVTIPSTYSAAMMGARTTYVVPANKKVSIIVRRDASEYVMWGDPIFVSTLTEDTTPATSASIEIDQGAGGERATIANIKKAMIVGTKEYGSIATGATGDVTLDWEGTETIVYNVGGNATHTLPLASGLVAPRYIVYQFNGSYTITLDPNAADYIRFNATTQADGVTITITGTAGQIAVIRTDLVNWSTAGGNATYAAGS